jgi:dTDP-4-dehydrorhamnose reductase
MLGRALVREFSRYFDIIPLTREELDITSAGACKKVAEAIKAEVLVNATGFTDVDECETRREEAMMLNSTAVGYLAEACRASGMKLVHFSTDYVFDGASAHPYQEDDKVHPLSIYGRSKLAGESAVTGSLIPYILIRTSWLFGKSGKNFVDTILKLSKQHSILKVVSDQKGSPTYTNDLAQAVGALVKMEATGIFHVTNSGSCTWHEFATEIVKQKTDGSVQVLPVDSTVVGRPAKRPAYSVLDNGKFRRTTGMQMRSWQEALALYLNECPT